MTIIPIDITNKTPKEVAGELLGELKNAGLDLDEMKKRPRIKRDNFILQVSIESDIELMKLKDLIAKALKPLTENDTFKGMTYGTITEYEWIENCVTHLRGHNNGSGCNFWQVKGDPESD